MAINNRFKHAVLVIGMLIILIPPSALIAFLSVPFLRWLENHYAIETVGHSGPAEWVYLVIYCLLVVLVAASFVWTRSHRTKSAALKNR